jgi:hypothetical protein
MHSTPSVLPLPLRYTSGTRPFHSPHCIPLRTLQCGASVGYDVPHFQTPKMGERDNIALPKSQDFHEYDYILLPHPCNSDGEAGGGHETSRFEK